MTPPTVTLTGRVERAWRTATGERHCILIVEGQRHHLSGPLPPLSRGCTLTAETCGHEVLRAERTVTEQEIAWAFYSALTGFARASAAKIIRILGDDTHRIITGGSAADVEGLSASGVRAMRQYAIREGRRYAAFQELAALGLPPEHARDLVKRHGAGAPSVFCHNPYGAADTVPLDVLDHAARLQGISSFDPRRNAALAYHVTQSAHDEYGHTALPESVLAGELRDQHALEDAEATRAVEDAVNAGLLTASGGTVTVQAAAETESRLAEDIIRLLTHSVPVLAVPRDQGTLTDEQQAAVQAAATSAFVIVTGGPGTGKTTTLSAILHVFDQANLTSVLCAPTGKAASRMSSSTGRAATTLHRLIGYDGNTYGSGALQGNVFVVDEVSMCSNELLSQFLRRVPSGARVILVGDEDQLPPIDAGHPLRALVRTVPTVRLTRTHRQAAGSPILKLAHMLISGDPPQGTGVPFRPAHSTLDAVHLVQSLITPEGPPMVLTAGRAGPLGVDALNAALQDTLNPGTDRFRVGDPVMATRNNHDTGLMNGMTGRVTRALDRLECVFDGNTHTFQGAALHHLTLAYAMTIHRSQGSEWPSVVVILCSDHHQLLTRELAYTAVTRAKRTLIASGDREAWNRSAQTPTPHRYSRLEGLLRA